MAAELRADFETTDRRRPATAYALARLANVLFTRELHRRYGAAGLSAAVVHPGFVNTSIGHASGSRFLVLMQRTQVRRLIATNGTVARANRAADDPALARELWERTLAAVGEKCPLATPLGTNDPRMRHGSA